MSVIRVLFFLFIFLASSSFSLSAKTRKEQQDIFTVMLDPAGDAKHTGRKLDGSFERGITLQCAEQLKQVIEERHKNVRVVLTRFPGETLQPLQNANFANRLDVDFYVSIHFYHEQNVKPKLFLYTFSYGDDFITKTFNLSFYPYDQAHIPVRDITKSWSSHMQTLLTADRYANQFEFAGIFAMPFKPIIGIKVPAIAVEMGLKNKDDWSRYIDPLAESITEIIKISS